MTEDVEEEKKEGQLEPWEESGIWRNKEAETWYRMQKKNGEHE